MKQLKKPTLAQKKMIAAAGYRWENWSVAGEDNVSLTIVSKKAGKRKVILK